MFSIRTAMSNMGMQRFIYIPPPKYLIVILISFDNLWRISSDRIFQEFIADISLIHPLPCMF